MFPLMVGSIARVASGFMIREISGAARTLDGWFLQICVLSSRASAIRVTALIDLFSVPAYVTRSCERCSWNFSLCARTWRESRTENLSRLL